MAIYKRKLNIKGSRATKYGVRRFVRTTPMVKSVMYRPTKHELKAKNLHDYGTLSTTGQIVLVNGIGAGNDINTRNGREIKMTNILINHRVTCDTSLIGHLWGHVWLIYDKAANGILPTFANIFVVADELTTMRVDQKWRYSILYHKKHNLWFNGGATTIYQSDKSSTFDDDKVLVNRKAQYLDTGTGIGDIATGAVYLVYISDNDDGEIHYNINTQFIDV